MRNMSFTCTGTITNTDSNEISLTKQKYNIHEKRPAHMRPQKCSQACMECRRQFHDNSCLQNVFPLGDV